MFWRFTQPFGASARRAKTQLMLYCFFLIIHLFDIHILPRMMPCQPTLRRTEIRVHPYFSPSLNWSWKQWIFWKGKVGKRETQSQFYNGLSRSAKISKYLRKMITTGNQLSYKWRAFPAASYARNLHKYLDFAGGLSLSFKRARIVAVDPFAPKSDQLQISSHTVWRTWLFIASDERWLYFTNSHYVTYTYIFKRFGRMSFLNVGVQGLNKASNGLCRERHCGTSREATVAWRKVDYVTRIETRQTYKKYTAKSQLHRPQFKRLKSLTRAPRSSGRRQAGPRIRGSFEKSAVVLSRIVPVF